MDVDSTRSDERLRRLEAVTDATLSRLDASDLLDELLDRVRDLLGADTAAILLLDPHSGQLVATAAKGIEEEVRRGVRIAIGRGFAGRVAETRRPLEPVCPSCRKAEAGLPLGQALLHGARDLLKQTVRHNQSAQSGKIGGGIAGVIRMAGTIHADADRDRECRIAFAFDQDTGDLGLPHQQVVWPLHFQVGPELWGAGSDRVMSGKRRDERELRRHSRG